MGHNAEAGNLLSELKVENESFIPAVVQLLGEGRRIRLPMSGSSMRPFVPAKGAVFELVQADAPLRVGDIVLARLGNGQYVMHRIVRSSAGWVWLNGDARPDIEGPCGLHDVVAIGETVCFDGHEYPLRHGWYRWMGIVWMRFLFARKWLMALRRGSKDYGDAGKRG